MSNLLLNRESTIKNQVNSLIKIWTEPKEEINFTIKGKNISKIYKEVSLFFPYNDKITILYLFSHIASIPKKLLWDFFDIETNINIKFDSTNIHLDDFFKFFELKLAQKETGSFYTSNIIINYINNKAFLVSFFNNISQEIAEKLLDKKELNFYLSNNIELITLIKKNETLLTKNDKVKIDNVLNNLKFLDPTCGDGGFLVDMLDKIVNFRKLLGLKIDYKKIIESNLYGNDFNEEATFLSKLRLLNFLFKSSNATNISKLKKINFNFYNDDFLNFNQLKFDAIIGNPPYFEYKNKDLLNFETKNINNIYAHIMEKSISLLKERGLLAMIVPISLTSTPRMEPLRKVIYNNLNNIFISHFADRPGSLFSNVHQKLNIIIGYKNEKTPEYYSSSYFYFKRHEINELFKNITYIKTNNLNYKIGNPQELIILNKINKSKNNLNDFILKNKQIQEHNLYLNMRIGFWVKCFSNNENLSLEYKNFKFKNENDKYLWLALLNSDLFYFFWNVVSDGWHITLDNLNNFKVNSENITPKLLEDIVSLGKQFEIELENNKFEINSKQSKYEYKHKLSKDLIDQLTQKICKEIYKIKKSDIEYIKNFNIKNRLNEEYDKYINKRD